MHSADYTLPSSGGLPACLPALAPGWRLRGGARARGLQVCASVRERERDGSRGGAGKKLCAKLDKGRAAGASKVKMDAERYVDLDGSESPSNVMCAGIV